MSNAPSGYAFYRLREVEGHALWFLSLPRTLHRSCRLEKIVQNFHSRNQDFLAIICHTTAKIHFAMVCLFVYVHVLFEWSLSVPVPAVSHRDRTILTESSSDTTSRALDEKNDLPKVAPGSFRAHWCMAKFGCLPFGVGSWIINNE